MTEVSPSSISSGLTTGIELVAAVLLVVITLGAVGVFVVLIVANRADPDPTNRRPLTVYLFGVSFIALWTGLIGSSAAVSSLVQLIGNHAGVSGNAVGNSAARGAVLGAIITLISVVLIVLHLQKAVALAADASPPSEAARRVGQSYVSAVAFVGVLVAAVALGVVIYAVCQIAGPGVFAGAGRIPALRRLLDAVYVVGAAVAIVSTHLRLAVSPLRRRALETADEG